MCPILIDRAAVVAEAVTWLGTPYHHRGRIKGVGTDCAMLLAEVYHRALPDLVPELKPEDYPPDWHMHRSAERYLAWVERFAREFAVIDRPAPADVVLYRWGRCLAHGAIVVEWPLVIHALLGQGVVYAEGDKGRLAGRERRFFTLGRPAAPLTLPSPRARGEGASAASG
jgi:NlpC/P60 family putative phage cell wall peptidase